MPAAKAYVHQIDAALDAVGKALAPSHPGIMVEHKGVTGSIHFRNAADPVAAGSAVTAALSAIAREQGLVVTPGKMVVELRPPIMVNKGTIITDLVREYMVKGALYMGDDYSDIDAFRALHELTRSGMCQGVSVAILHSEAPPHMTDEADMTLNPAERSPSLLRWLVRNARKVPAST
jgi:trehalose 6-phosphate phosphatase